MKSISVQRAKAEIVQAMQDYAASFEFLCIMRGVLIRDPVDSVNDLEVALRLARQYADAVADAEAV